MDDWSEDTIHIYHCATDVTESDDIDGLCPHLLLSVSVPTGPDYQISPPYSIGKGTRPTDYLYL